MLRRWMMLLVFVVISVAAAQRVCQTPDCLFVESVGAARSLQLFIYVPPTTNEFVIAVFDQNDDALVGQPSSFLLHAPDGRVAMRLEQPQSKEWAEYRVSVNGQWGVWRLSIAGPQPPPAPEGQRPKPVRNNFLVRTVGDVDLYIKPEPVVLARGIRFSEPHFGGETTHRFAVQVPELQRFRFNIFRPRGEQVTQVQLQPPDGVIAEQRWGGLTRGILESLEVTGSNLKGLWELNISNVRGVYSLGIEQELRVFFTDSPLMPMPVRASVSTFISDENELVPARLDITSPQTATESYVTFTDRSGLGALFLLPGITYRITASRGFEFEAQTVFATAYAKEFSVPVRRRLNRPTGWYGGDNHAHSVYSDGNDTPAQMAEAARGEGLDWFVLTDHGAGPFIQHVLKANEEAMTLSEPGKFVVIPGEEFTTPDYHANVINGTVLELPTVPLQQVIDVVLKMDSEERPVTIKLNHPTWGGTPKAVELARQLERLPLIELWNSPEPQTTQLWWELLNKGMRIFAETSTDTHNRKTSPLGHRRTYIYLGNKPLTAENIVKAIKEGRSFLSRGALLFFTVNGAIPGDTVAATQLSVRVEVESVSPVDRIELVQNGKVAHTFNAGGQTKFVGEVTLPMSDGWILVQAMDGKNPIPLAMTNPVFVRTP